MAQTNVTALMPPLTGVRLAWALTGGFTEDVVSKCSATLAEQQLRDIRAAVVDGKSIQPGEYPYVMSATATIQASVRNLDIIYKGRQLNFEENAKLREKYLESVRDTLEFGTKAKDFLKSLPMATVVTAGGTATLAAALNISGVWLVAAGAGLALVGYWFNRLLVDWGRRHTQKLYIDQDYERSIYYRQYLDRVTQTLTSLYLDLERIHQSAFGGTNGSAVGRSEALLSVLDVLKGTEPTFCRYIHKHSLERRIRPELWFRCETGVPDVVGVCPEWKKENPGS